MESPRTYSEFWPYYLREHARPETRLLHVLGTGIALALLIAAALLASLWLLLAAVVAGYAFAWISHLAVEGNRPATFRFPLWSLYSDGRMALLWATGRLQPELDAHLVQPPESAGRGQGQDRV